jgi:uncharacterized membrane protein YbaN (DUF454 family)
MQSFFTLPKPVWMVVGIFFSGLGIAGIILPMMPGLVFFILASYCFAKGSPKLLRKLLSHPHIGPQIMDWKRGKGMRMRTKLLAIALVTLSLSFSAVFMVKPLYVKWIIFISIIAIDGYILSVKTRKDEGKINLSAKSISHEQRTTAENP